MCWASAALPPLPTIRSLLPALSALMMPSAIASASASSTESATVRSNAASDCFRWVPIRSFDALVNVQPSLSSRLGTCRLAAAQAQESSMRGTRDRLAQDALGDLNHVGGRNVAHAA